MHFQEIIDFWFRDTDTACWWKKDADFDRLIREKFLDIHRKAEKCELYTWRENGLGRLAEIIILDQFSRNLYRDSNLAFANDALALSLSQEAISCRAGKHLDSAEKSFLYMPFMHSESRLIHELALELYSAPGLEHNLEFERKHKRIIDRFGRYPHRNELLGRESTEEELAFLQEPNSSF